MEREETLKLENYLKKKLHPGITVKQRDRTSDSVEVYLGAEFLALIYKDVDEGEVAYQFQMTVLEEDLTA